MTKAPDVDETQPLSIDERAELERLRALHGSDAPLAAPRRPGRGRWAGAIVLLLVAALLAPLSALARWTNTTLLDTDSYVSMVAPLAEDPAVQEEISRRITDAVFQALKVEQLTAQTLTAIGERPRVEGLTSRLPVELSTFAEPISNAIYGFTEDQVTKLVASDAFEDAWVVANREAHARLVAALTGEPATDGVTVSDGQVTVDLAPFIAAIKPVLVERGVPFADRIPAVNAEFLLLDSASLSQAQTAFRHARPAPLGPADHRGAAVPRGGRPGAGPQAGPRHRRLHDRRLAGAAAPRRPAGARRCTSTTSSRRSSCPRSGRCCSTP